MLDIEANYNLLSNVEDTNLKIKEYVPKEAEAVARLMTAINDNVTRTGVTGVKAVFGQQYIIQKGLKEFGESARIRAMKELAQLHKRNCSSPIKVNKMTPEEKRKAQNGMMLVTEKRDNSIKGRLVYDGSKTRDWVSREEAASPTVSLESLFITSVINTKEN